jgi:hypothetical protein
MKFDKHHITCNIYTEKGSTHGAACCDGKIGPLWDRTKDGIAEDDKIIGWTFWVTLRRGPIEITAHGDENYTIVLQRAERILLASEAAYNREHAKGAEAA